MDAIDQAIGRVMDAALLYAKARAAVMELEDNRPAHKQAAILRIIETGPNPLTGKQHSASSAEAVVETDAGYAAYRKLQREAVITEITAGGNYEAAKFRARQLTAIAETTV